MASRDRRTDRAARRARHALEVIGQEVGRARRQAGLSQQRLGALVGCSQAQVSRIEAAQVTGLPILTAARVLSAVGRDLSVRVYPGAAPVHDAAQLAILGRLRPHVADTLSWRTEVPIPIPGDQRAIDLVIGAGGGAGGGADGGPGRGPDVSVAVECISRLEDAQSAERAGRLKQRDAGLSCLVLVLADTRHNRAAVAGAPTLATSFPHSTRAILAALRAGRQPPGDGIVFV
jgi:transcriptional regulator with XRE-family HTH domain